MPVNTAEDISVSFKYFGLDPSASLATAKEAYKRYAKEFHPDLFPYGSDEQKLASEKLIAANAHFEKLEKFFEDYPEGKPLGDGQTRQEPQDVSDWEDWEKQRHDVFNDELQEWKKRHRKIEKEKVVSRESFRRGKLVRNCRVGLVLMTVVMWWGWSSQFSKLDSAVKKNGQNNESQNQQPHYIDPVTGIDVNEASRQKIERLRSEQGFVNPEEKIKEMPGKIILLLIWTAAAGWLLFSVKGRAIAVNYLEGANKEAS